MTEVARWWWTFAGGMAVEEVIVCKEVRKRCSVHVAHGLVIFL